MDMTVEEYIDFVNHLLLQELCDFESRRDVSTSDALELIE